MDRTKTTPPVRVDLAAPEAVPVAEGVTSRERPLTRRAAEDLEAALRAQAERLLRCDDLD